MPQRKDDSDDTADLPDFEDADAHQGVERLISRLWRERDRQLATIFGPMEPMVLAGERGWAWEDGSPTINVYRAVSDRVVFCTSDLTTPYGDSPLDYELHIVVRADSPLAQWPHPPAAGLLREVAESTRKDSYDAGHMVGPLHERYAPFSRLLFLEANDRFWMEKRHCRLLLLFGIHESERRLWKTGGVSALMDKLFASNVLPFTDPMRPPLL